MMTPPKNGELRQRKTTPDSLAETPPAGSTLVWTCSTSSSLHGSWVESAAAATASEKANGAGNHEDDKNSTGSSSNAPQTSVRHDETRLRKILSRIVYGSCMMSAFMGLIYMGHLFVCALVAVIEIILFKELVRVRYSAYFSTIQDTIPLFRTTQWLWFAVSVFYTYGDFVSDIIQNNQELHYLLSYAQYLSTMSFMLYSGTFVLTIATLQREHIRFQLNQLCWTILVIMLTVGQLKYVMHNIFNGLIWFVLPSCLIICNDVMAYASGMAFGRRFIQRPFIRVSPNKTWEGFIGGALLTLIMAWYLSLYLTQSTWMTCPTNEFNLFPSALDCQPDPIFLQAHVRIPPQIFELLPRGIVKMLPHIVELCSSRDYYYNTGTSSTAGDLFSSSFSRTVMHQFQRYQQQGDAHLQPCISGDESLVHHHFELTLRNYYPIQVHALWLGLFASLVAPFGGFLASAIKRAYRIKDFDSLIPGHGGMMDRMDCQFLMALYTWVHYNTFVKLATVSVPKLQYMYSLLSEQEKVEFLESIMDTGKQNGGRLSNGPLKRLSLQDFAFG